MYALFDTGATFSCINEEAAQEIDSPGKLHAPLEVVTASEGHYIKVNEVMHAEFYYDDIRLFDEFMVVPGLSEEVIIGVHTLQKWRIKLDFEHDTVIVNPYVARI